MRAPAAEQALALHVFRNGKCDWCLKPWPCESVVAIRENLARTSPLALAA